MMVMAMTAAKVKRCVMSTVWVIVVAVLVLSAAVVK